MIPSFMTTELKRAFTAGFLLYIPFLLIDIIVSSTLHNEQRGKQGNQREHQQKLQSRDLFAVDIHKRVICKCLIFHSYLITPRGLDPGPDALKGVYASQYGGGNPESVHGYGQ